MGLKQCSQSVHLCFCDDVVTHSHYPSLSVVLSVAPHTIPPPPPHLAHTHTYTHTHMYVYTNTDACHKCTHQHMHADICTHTHTHTCIHIQSIIHNRTSSCGLAGYSKVSSPHGIRVMSLLIQNLSLWSPPSRFSECTFSTATHFMFWILSSIWLKCLVTKGHVFLLMVERWW